MSRPFSKLDWLSAALRGADDISHAQKTVLTVMYTYSDAHGENIRPGMTRIINESRTDRKTVKSALRRLTERGYIAMSAKGGNEVRQGWANTYRLSTPVRLTQTIPQGGDSLAPLLTVADSQGGDSFPQGGDSFPPRGPMVPHQGGDLLDSHQVIDQVIHQGIESFTIDSHEPTGDVLTKKERSRLLDHISYVAHALGNDCTEEQHEDAERVLSSNLENLLGREAAEEWDNSWHVTGRQLERYEAGKKLTQFINHCISQDIPLARMEGAA